MGPCVGGAIAGVLYNNAFRAPKKEPRAQETYEYEECAKGEMKEVA